MKITIPDGWHQVSIKTLQELHESKDDLNERIAILANEDPESVKVWDLTSIEKVTELLKWIDELPKIETLKKEIIIDEVKYVFNDKLSRLTGNDWLSLTILLQEPIKNLHKIASFFYKGDAELFREKMNVQDCYGCILFFSNIGTVSLESLQDYLQTEVIKMKMKQKLKEKKEKWQNEKQQNGTGMLSFTWLRRAARLN